MLRWLRRWRERDDQHLVKRAAPLPADPIDELCRIINEAQQRDAEDERRLYRPMRGKHCRDVRSGEAALTPWPKKRSDFASPRRHSPRIMAR